MKKMMSMVLGLVLVTGVAAKADDLAVWTFESSVPTTAGPHAAEGGINGGNAIGFHVSGATVYSNPVGNGSFESFSSNNWTSGDYYLFETSTLGYEDITFGWSQTRSGTGPADFSVDYSIDGVNFASVLNYNVAQITWSSLGFLPESVFGPITLPSDANDLATVYVRVTSLVTSAAGGTNRIDDVVIGGTLIPEPASFALLMVGAVAALRRRGC